MEYTIDYFIEKFSLIPDRLWTTGIFYTEGEDGSMRYCALGHCGIGSGDDYNAEAAALVNIFNVSDMENFGVVLINDGHCPLFKQDHPKDRMLAALRFIKTRQLT